MDHQSLRISDVGDDQRDIQGIDNGKSLLLASGSYSYDSSVAIPELLFRNFVIRAFFQSRIIYFNVTTQAL